MIEIAATAGQSPPTARARIDTGGSAVLRSATPGESQGLRASDTIPIDIRQSEESTEATETTAPRESSVLADALAREVLEERTPRQVDLRLSVDDELGRVIAQVVDGDSGEVIRQVPPEDIIEMAKTFRALNGQVVDRRI